MTKRIGLDVMQEIFLLCEKDINGWIKTTDFLKFVVEKTNCTIPTAYKIMNSQPNFFEVSHGKLRQRQPVKDDDLSFLDWIDSRSRTLDKIVEFLKIQPMTSKIENYLVKIGFVREELKSGVDNGLLELKVLLEQDYGYILDV